MSNRSCCRIDWETGEEFIAEIQSFATYLIERFQASALQVVVAHLTSRLI